MAEHAHAKELFLGAIGRPSAERPGFLENACGSDVRLRHRVEELLDAHEAAGQFLNGAAAGGNGAITIDRAGPTETLQGHGETTGTVIGRYKLLQLIGEGGFGSVFMAEQTQPVVRRVALKIIKAGMDTKQVIARFEAERQALALMDHPNIAKVLDAGATESGRPYFVMELVRGDPVTQYCDRERLSVQKRLKLFRDICNAVQHAHQKGVIHRDLKPSNVLVTVADAEPLPKVIDFGIAKATAGRLTDKTLFTEHRALIGTPAYMSPEQAEMSGVDIDTRSDIYALGVLLYELLAGSTPLESGRLRSAPFAEVQRMIREEDPPKPSTRLSSLREGTKGSRDRGFEGLVDSTSPGSLGPSVPGSLPGVAARRRTDPTSLVRQLRRDLDWIVMKCLEKDRRRRYATANELADDVGRYLDHQPVLASPPSAGYKLRKFVRRNRGAVLAGAMIAITLVVASGVSVTFGLSEARQRKAAQAAEAEAKLRAAELEQVAKFQEAQLSGIDARTMGVGLREDLIEKVRAAAERSKRSPDEVNARIGELERFIAGSDFTGVALEALEANFFAPALAAIERDFSDQPAVQARLLQTLASTLRDLGLLDAADGPQQQALEIRRQVLGTEHPDTVTSLMDLAALRQAQGKLAAAETHFGEALEIGRRALGNEHVSTLRALSGLGKALANQGRLSQAERYWREALDSYRRVLGDDHEYTLSSMNNVGTLLHRQGKLSEAEHYYREVLEKRRRTLGDAHPETLTFMNNLGYLLKDQGELEEAEAYLTEALATRRRVLGDEHPDTLSSISNLAMLLYAQGKFDAAEPYMLEALATCRRVLGDEHSRTLHAISNMGALFKSRGDLAAAEPYARESLESSRRVLGEDHPDTLVAVLNMGTLLQAMGKSTEAIELLFQAEPAVRRAFTGDNALRLGRLLTALGRARAATGAFDAARANLSEAQAILSEAKNASDAHRIEVLTGLVELYDAWHAAEPDKGFDAKAAEWRAKLAAGQGSTQPAGP